MKLEREVLIKTTSTNGRELLYRLMFCYETKSSCFEGKIYTGLPLVGWPDCADIIR